MLQLEESNAKEFLFDRGGALTGLLASLVSTQARLHMTLSTAFDKGDLLYLRDQEERQRHMELEQKESETMAFARLRAKAEAAATALPPTLHVPKPPAAKKPCVGCMGTVGNDTCTTLPLKKALTDPQGGRCGQTCGQHQGTKSQGRAKNKTGCVAQASCIHSWFLVHRFLCIVSCASFLVRRFLCIVSCISSSRTRAHATTGTFPNDAPAAKRAKPATETPPTCDPTLPAPEGLPGLLGTIASAIAQQFVCVFMFDFPPGCRWVWVLGRQSVMKAAADFASCFCAEQRVS